MERNLPMHLQKVLIRGTLVKESRTEKIKSLYKKIIKTHQISAVQDKPDETVTTLWERRRESAP